MVSRHASSRRIQPSRKRSRLNTPLQSNQRRGRTGLIRLAIRQVMRKTNAHKAKLTTRSDRKYGYWGVATVLAVSAAYVLMGILGHGVMRLVAGPARNDPLARWPWEAAKPAAGAGR